MPTRVDFPTIVQDAVDGLGARCANEPARRHCAASLTGLLGAAKHTVRGSPGAWVVTTDPAGWTRWLPEVPWAVKALTDRRVAWWQGEPKTRHRPRGVMALAQTRVDHAGQRIAAVGGCWDHAHERSVSAHDARRSHAVGPAGAPAPLDGRRGKKKAAGQQGEGTDHLAWGIAWLNAAIGRGSPGDCPCDRSVTRAQGLHHRQSTTRASVGERQRHRTLGDDGRAPALQAVARQRPGPATPPVRVGNRRSWYCGKPLRLPEVTQPVRMGRLWQDRNEAEARHALVRHRLVWEAMRLGVGYRHRWAGTATLPRAGPQAWGLGECQGRHGAGQPRHVSLVSAASRRLRHALHQSRPQDGARTMLTTIGAACRAVKGARLEQWVDGMVDKRADAHGAIPPLTAVLAQT